MDIHRVFHPTTDDTFFSAIHRTLSKIVPILGHKANLKNYKEIKTILYILTNHNTINLEISVKQNYKKYSNTRRLNNTH
jgi:hypothetical protein